MVLGEKICKTGIYTESLSLREKFAVVFVVNHLFHGGLSRARRVKDYVQRTIVAYHHGQIKMRYVASGEHAGTFEISYEIWSTHLPRSLVRKGKLERPGRPSVVALMQKVFGPVLSD
jgi:hypothetical protein